MGNGGQCEKTLPHRQVSFARKQPDFHYALINESVIIPTHTGA